MRKIMLIGLCILILLLPGLDAALTDDLLQCYDGDTNSSTSYVDSSPNSNNGTIGGATYTTTNCKLGGCFDFDGANDHINISVAQYTHMTYSLWVRPDSNTAGDSILGNAADTNFFIQMATAASYLWMCYGVSTGVSATPATWHHLICYFNGTGTLSYHNATTNSSGLVPPTETTAMRLGVRGDTGTTWFDGLIDQVLIYNRSLTGSEISEIYNGSKGISCPVVPVPPITAASDIIFSNNSNASPVTSSADESAAFWVFGNWTLSNGTIITDADGDCNFSNGVSYKGAYNSTLGLWRINQSLSFSTHGNKSITLNCTHYTNSSFTLNRAENIYITNIAPDIVFDSVNTVTTSYNLVNNVHIEYNVNVWNWTVNVTDDDETNWTYYIYNSSGSQLQTGSGTSTGQLSFTTAAEFFRWFENPYNLTVIWRDSGLENSVTNESIRFIVNDTVSPMITWFSPANQSSYDKMAGGQIEFFSQCSDPALYRYNLTVYNLTTPILSYQAVNILGTIWNNQSFVDVADFATLNNATNYSHSVMTLCADSHTGEALEEAWTPEKDFVEDMTFARQGISLLIKERDNVASFEPVFKEDRVSFDIRFKTPVKTLTIDLRGTDIVPVANDLGYACHAVLSDPKTLEPRYWFDADMPGLESCKLVCLGSDYCQAIVTLKESEKEIEMESVGEVNIYNETRYFNVYDSSVLTVNWTGLVCGERYPNDEFNLSFEGEDISNCTLHINDRLFTGWTGDCGNLSIETGIGRQYLELSFLDPFNASTVDICTIWTDKIDKEVGDFMWLIILGVVWGFLVFMSFSSAPALSIVGGLVGIFVSYELMAYSMVLAGIFLLFNVVIIFKR